MSPGIREALKDYPELIEIVQDDLNDVVADLIHRRATFSAFEEASWALEGRFDEFYIDTNEDVEDVEAAKAGAISTPSNAPKQTLFS